MKAATRHFFRALLLVCLLGLGLCAAAGWWLYQDYRAFVDQPMAMSAEEQIFEVRRGDSFRDVLAGLRRLGIQEGHDLYWRALAWELGVMRRLQVGEYAVEHDSTPRKLLLRLERGDVVQYRFTLIPGWNLRDLRAALAANPVLVQTLAGRSDESLMEAVGSPGLPAEGQFLPETYQFTRGSSDLDILKRAHLALRAALQQAWESRVPGLPLETPEQALVLASIIEKETGQAGERREIAGVFIRRLKLGMRLQTDPTVIYGIGAAFDGNLTRRHLETDTPWNTYTRAGLPPTPIALASPAALKAAVDPAEGETLYFVSRGDGTHHFSRTLAEHNAAVRRYQLRRR
ncbi:endolytic transglycosylase MltG [Pseudomarimonas salicorniae]|uniref:Endolytic murein transglycosylase n=1 Tax=Pseudomarimonas salicorniae TaxID=2933270 RepID=A0ABT0GJK9_9GAMM|nr:endolytic transglycosylase MltG [Lysobacter sp. CAU 1642]MCK7594726.1 endolytic transglycosylase MltG [Lysobacter sp. CAU 1642]